MKNNIPLAIAALAICTSCQPSSLPTSSPTTSATLTTAAPTQQPTSLPETEEATAQAAQFGYTHHNIDGNRWVEGRGNLPDAPFIDIPLNGTPTWVAALPDGSTSLWAVVLQDGRVQAFRVSSQGAESIAISPDQLNPQTPPLLSWHNNTLELVIGAIPQASPLTHPIFIDDIAATIDLDGKLQVGEFVIATDALPDARIVHDETGRLLVLSGATDSYPHGVLGDAIEASSILVVESMAQPHIVQTISMPDGLVLEGIAPIWADLDEDDKREIVVTASDARLGSRLMVYDETGNLLAVSEAIGQGFRWQHQIAIAPFGPQREMELVAVRTPHLGGIVEFFQFGDGQLAKVAELAGYTSHLINSRNLDMAVAGDFDGDGQVELVLPNQALTELGAVRRTTNGAEIAWSVPLGDTVSANIGVVTLDNDKLALGVGLANGLLRIWLPQNSGGEILSH